MFRLSLLALVLTVSLGHADLLKSVPVDSRASLAAGEVYINSTNVEGAVWPKLSLYQVVNAPPKVVWNLLTDLNSAPSYTPNLISAKVLATNPNGSKNVQYTVKVPILMRISYTVQNTYTVKGNNSYEVSWTLIQSPLAKKSDGSIRIEPYGQGKTLLCYTNLVIPITNLVAGLKNQALQEAKATVEAIQNEAERRAAQ